MRLVFSISMNCVDGVLVQANANSHMVPMMMMMTMMMGGER
jgi:hypothetical protein